MRIAILPALLVCFGTAAATESASFPDVPSSRPMALDPGEVSLRTAILPAWGSYASESYLTATVQTVVDAAALLALVGFFVAPPNPDAGVHLVPVVSLGVLAANRLASLPLNLALAVRYNRDPRPFWGNPLDPGRLHGAVFAVAGGYSGGGELAAAVEWKRMGLKLAIPYMKYSRGGSYTLDYPDGTSFMESYEVEPRLALESYTRVRLNKFMDAEPGVKLAVDTYRYWSGLPGGASNPRAGSKADIHPVSLSVIPRFALLFRPLPRLEYGLGVGYALVRPGHERDFADRRRAAGYEWGIEGIGFSTELGVTLW